MLITHAIPPKKIAHIRIARLTGPSACAESSQLLRARPVRAPELLVDGKEGESDRGLARAPADREAEREEGDLHATLTRAEEFASNTFPRKTVVPS